jgi:uncharacterized protein
LLDISLNVASLPSTCTVNKNRMNELLVLLKDKEQKFSLSVRAANALSILDGMTQDKMMKSHIRTMLWQVVSNLEGIRE